MTSIGTLKTKLDRRDFVVTAEIVPKLTADPAAVLEQAAPLKGRVDAVNVTDGAGARVTMSSVAACALLVADGIEPIMHMTCRDRNRIALAADLIGASALGIRNILILNGDDPSKGDEPDAKPVYDLDSAGVVQLARSLAQEGKTISGRDLGQPAALTIGGADIPFDPPSDWTPERLEQRIDAGVDFIQTQFCFEPDATKRYFDVLSEHGIPERLPFIVGVGPVASARSARWMNENLFGVSVPDEMIERLENAADPRAEGRRFCVELIETYREIPGIAGVHIMAPAQSSDRIAAVLDDLGIG